jgi:hypothetical protein
MTSLLLKDVICLTGRNVICPGNCHLFADTVFRRCNAYFSSGFLRHGSQGISLMRAIWVIDSPTIQKRSKTVRSSSGSDKQLPLDLIVQALLLSNSEKLDSMDLECIMVLDEFNGII